MNLYLLAVPYQAASLEKNPLMYPLLAHTGAKIAHLAKKRIYLSDFYQFIVPYHAEN